MILTANIDRKLQQGVNDRDIDDSAEAETEAEGETETEELEPERGKDSKKTL
jgi:hypothetical protein